MPLTREQGWKIAFAIPGTEERLWFHKPSVFLHDRFLTKVHSEEDAMVLQVSSMEMRDVMLDAEPELFYITDHYRNFPFLLVRLKALSKKALEDLLAARAAQLAALPPIKRRPKKTTTKKKKSA